eukprot:jgi/Ulvmu1/8157/UM040_0054.1
MALCQTVRREELMEVQRRLIDCQHENVALRKRNGELQATVFELNKWKTDISDIAAEADAAFQLQKNQWDEERVALNRRNNSIADERNQLHHELCTAKRQLGEVAEKLQSKVQELNALTIQHRDFVLQNDGLPDKVLRLQKENDRLQATLQNKTTEIDKLRTDDAIKNVQLAEELDRARTDLKDLRAALAAEGRQASRSLAVAEASYNKEIARINGEKLRQEEITQEQIKQARDEAFSQSEAVSHMASQLNESQMKIVELKSEAEASAEALKQLQLQLAEAEEGQRLAREEAIAARAEADKARISREEAVAKLHMAAEAAADGTEEAMRVVHECDVAAQQQQEREKELKRRTRDLDDREEDIGKREAAAVARSVELEAMCKQHEADATETAELKATLQSDQAVLEARVASTEKAETTLAQQQEALWDALASLKPARVSAENRAAGGCGVEAKANGEDAKTDGGDGVVCWEGDVQALVQRLRLEREEHEALRREVEGLQAAREVAQQQLGKLRREELEAQSKLRGAQAAAAAAVDAAERAAARLQAAEAAVPTPSPSPILASPVVAEAAAVVSDGVVAEAAPGTGGVSGAQDTGEAEGVSGIMGAISPLLGRLGWGGQTRVSTTSKAPVAAVTEAPVLAEPASPVELSVPGAARDATAPTPQLGFGVSMSKPRASTGPGSTPKKRRRPALHSQGSGRGSAEAAEAAGSADRVEANRGKRTRRRVQQEAATEAAARGQQPGEEEGAAAGGEHVAGDSAELAGVGDGAGADAVADVQDTNLHRKDGGQAAGVAVVDEAAVSTRERESADMAIPATPPSSGTSKVGGKKSKHKAVGVAVRDSAEALPPTAAEDGQPAADAESLVPGMETPLAGPAGAADASFWDGGKGAEAAAVQMVTPPTIRTVRLSQVVGEGGAGRASARGRRPQSAAGSAQHRPRRGAASSAAAAIAAEALVPADVPGTPSASGGAPSTPGGRTQRQPRVSRRMQELLEEAAHITGLTPSELVVDEDGAAMSARAARSASRAASKAGKDSIADDGEEEVQGGADAGNEHEAERRRRRWRRTQTGTLRTPSQLLPHIREEGDESGEE